MRHPAAPVPHLVRNAVRARPRTRLGRALESIGAALALPVILLAGLATAAAAQTQLTTAGVEIVIGTSPGASERTITIGGNFYVVGQAERGPTGTPIELRSMADYASRFGNRVTYGTAYDVLECFFAEGGGRAYFIRIAGPAATTGVKVLNDRAGAPLATVNLTAMGPGAWSTGLTVAVANGVLADKVTVTLSLGTLVEPYLEVGSPEELVAAVNATSVLATAALAGSVTAAPNNNPAVLAATAFSAGADDRASITAASYTAALPSFPLALGGGSVAIPGQTAATVGVAVAAHCRSTAFRRTGILTTAAGQTKAQAIAAAGARRADPGAETCGLFWPHVKTPVAGGGNRTISPEGAVAAWRARAIRNVGPWASPAKHSRASWVVGVETESTREDIDELAAARVNTLATRDTVRLRSWRSLSADDKQFRRLSAIELLHYFAERGDAILDDYLEETIDPDGQLQSRLYGDLAGMVDPIRQAGGLFGKKLDDGTVIDRGYVIDVGPTVNTTTSLGENKLRATLAFRESPNAELVIFTITKVAFDSSL